MTALSADINLVVFIEYTIIWLCLQIILIITAGYHLHVICSVMLLDNSVIIDIFKAKSLFANNLNVNVNFQF